MNRKELEQKAMQLIAELISIRVEDVKLDSSFINDLHFDSLDAVELIMTVEDEFNIDVTDEEAEKMTSVILLVEFLEKKLKG
jgi:acyl carrier protein